MASRAGAAEDYYAILGVPPTAQASRIRRAYQRLARRIHPDLNPNDRVSAELYARVREAFETLGDPERRAEYDRRGREPPSPPNERAAHYGFAGFDFRTEEVPGAEALHEIFGRRAAQRDGPGDGVANDIHHRVRLSFREAVEGRQVRVRAMRKERCDACAGSGRRRDAGGGIRCSACAGDGKRVLRYGHMVFTRACRQCDGKGAFHHRSCRACGGRGRRSQPVRILARVAPGVADGATLVLPGQGHHGPPGKSAGDFHLHVEVTPHPVVTREGDDLVCPLPLTLAEAALGGRIEVPTLEGPVSVRLPPGIQPGARVRLPGRGLPTGRGEARGDLYLVAEVRVPRIRDDRSRKLIRELEARHPASPRKALREKLREGD